MLPRSQVVAAVREILLRNWPDRFAADEVLSDVSLGEEGLGLDSVEIVEVVLACEELCGRSATKRLWDTAPLTIERIADHFCEAAA